MFVCLVRGLDSRRPPIVSCVEGPILYIVIAGCGKVGAALATSLSAGGHNVAVIDRNDEAFANLGNTFNGLTILGNAIDEDVLRSAGIEQADAFAAATDHDSANIMACQIARDIFGVSRVVARVAEPQREEAFTELGLLTVCGTRVLADMMEAIVLLAGVRARFSLGSGEVAIAEFAAPRGVDGLTAGDFDRPPSFKLCALTRGGRTVIPDASWVIQEGDVLALAVRLDDIGDLRALLGGNGRGRR